MTSKSARISAAVGSLLALGTLAAGPSALAADSTAKAKCYGIAKAGQNDYASKTHGCQGQAKTDNDPGDWKLLARDECEKLGGSTTPAKKAE